jgi:P-loop Domain of unknown function (DUF2791)
MGAILSAGEQALVDLEVSSASEVSFVRHEDGRILTAYLDELTRRADGRGFVTARVSLRHDRAFDSLDTVVRQLMSEVTVPGARRATQKGLLPLLDAFLHREGRAALATFDANIGRVGLSGDLTSLARAYIESAKQPRQEKARIEAWLRGVELARADVEAPAVSALATRTAKRALSELTRIVRALGMSGTLLVLTDADVLLSLSPARRDDAYTVLRELVDNMDSGRGVVATRLVVTGTTPLYVGTRSLASLAPLQSRVVSVDTALPTPHRPMVDLVFSLFTDTELGRHEPVAPSESRAAEVRALVRASQGLPPTEAILSMSVGHEAIDRTIDGLFEHSSMEGSVFTLLSGPYGSGKTHLLLHLAARARAERRPILRLSLERLDADLGNPQRHLRRMLEQAELPLPGAPSILDLLHAWIRVPRKQDALMRELARIATDGSDASPAAARALRAASSGASKSAGLLAILGGVDLETRSNAPNYRQDAYGRLLLWLTLLERLEECAGPALMIDEAENLYKGGSSRSERRTALRSLAFYCGGALPSACVVLALTPDVLPELQSEAKELLDEVSEQRTLLTWEDAAMFRRRLIRSKPTMVPALLDEHKELLASRVRKTHAAVRGAVKDPAWADHLASLATPSVTPREVVRRTVERLESLWWGSAER